MQVTWTEDLELGIPHIDEQHKGLFDSLNKLYTAIENKHVRIVLPETIHELACYAVNHLISEENYMILKGDPNRFTHAEEHKLFRCKVEELITSYEHGDPQVENDIADYIANWLVTHIKTTDYTLREL